MLDLVSKNIHHYTRQALFHSRPEAFPDNFNRANRLLWKYPVELGWDAERRLMFATDDWGKLYCCRYLRVNRYRNGIGAFLDKLAEEYMLPRIGFAKGDWVIDCGANIGEVSTWLQRRHAGINVIAVEPEKLEADCADLNVFGGEAQTVRKALWNEETELTFFQKGETADGSVFEIEDYTGKTTIRTIMLDDLLRERGVRHVRLLKLEAEGAEPEILLGAQASLENIDFIAADCGPERGLQQTETASDIINFLLPRGFEIVEMKFHRVVCLLRNRRAAR
jgi:FkbM family methyltransferase